MERERHQCQPARTPRQDVSLARPLRFRAAECSPRAMDSDMTATRLAHIEASRNLEDNGMRHVRCCVQTTVHGPRNSLVTFDFLNKGAANVIFKIQPWHQLLSASPFLFVNPLQDDDLTHAATLSDSSHLMGRVLRVPRGGPKHLSSLQIVHGFEQAVRPLFLPGTYEMVAEASVPGPASCTVRLSRDLSKYLMENEAVLLSADVMQYLYTRVEKGTFVDTPSRKCWGILLPDMSPSHGRSLTLEVKPKWLAQSPNAPPEAVRCRTCAMQVSIPKSRNTYICPLRLLHDDSTSLRPWACTMVIHQFDSTTGSFGELQSRLVISAIVERLLAYLTAGDGRDLLQHLSKLQNTLDPRGVLCRPQEESKSILFDHNLRLAMTLRDCSLFIRVSYDASGVTDMICKLGDLDFKSAEKLMDWKDKERQLLTKNSYTAAGGPKCWLERV
jgi:inositol-pentakisphosphate 2-kinase